jgi:hypothetical protein
MQAAIREVGPLPMPRVKLGRLLPRLLRHTLVKVGPLPTPRVKLVCPSPKFLRHSELKG